MGSTHSLEREWPLLMCDRYSRVPMAQVISREGHVDSSDEAMTIHVTCAKD